MCELPQLLLNTFSKDTFYAPEISIERNKVSIGMSEVPLPTDQASKIREERAK